MQIRAARELKTLDLSQHKNLINTDFTFSFINKDCKWILPKGVEIDSWTRETFSPPVYHNVLKFKLSNDPEKQITMTTAEIREKYLKLRKQPVEQTEMIR